MIESREPRPFGALRPSQAQPQASSQPPARIVSQPPARIVSQPPAPIVSQPPARIVAQPPARTQKHSARVRCFFAFLALLTSTLASLVVPGTVHATLADELADELAAVTPHDYAPFESLGSPQFSPDGRWLSFSLRRNNGKNELCLRLVATDTDEIFYHGARPTFSDDGKWFAYSIGVSDDEREKLEKAGKPVPERIALRNLISGDTEEFANFGNFAFSGDSHYFAARTSAEPADVVVIHLGQGTRTLIGNVNAFSWSDEGHLLALQVGSKAATPGEGATVGNGVQVYQPSSERLRTLYSAQSTFSSMTWRQDHDDLAILEVQPEKPGKDSPERGNPEPNHKIHVWRSVADDPRHHVYDSTTDEDFPKSHRIVDFASLRFSESGESVFFGVAELTHGDDDAEEKKAESRREPSKETPEKDSKAEGDRDDRERDAESNVPERNVPDSDVPKKDDKTPAPRIAVAAQPDDTPTLMFEPAPQPPRERRGTREARQRRNTRSTRGEEVRGDNKPEPPEKPKTLRETLEEPSNVEVWHARDVDIIPLQKRRLQRERRFNYLATWWIDDDQFVQLANDLSERVNRSDGESYCVGRDNTPYEEVRKFGPTLEDVYRIDMRSGERQRIAERVKYHVFNDPSGRTLIYLADGDLWTLDLHSLERRNITEPLDGDFIDNEAATLTDEAPPYGGFDWTEDGKWLYLRDRWDIWQVEVATGSTERLTRGREKKQEYARLAFDREQDEFIDRNRPVYATIYGDRSKQSGLARIDLRTRKVQQLMLRDKSLRSWVKAKNEDLYAYVEQAFDDSPDLFVSGPDFDTPRALTETNPQLRNFAWGRGELIDYESATGVPLQGALIYPARYQPGQQYPMIVYIYEKLSQNLHRFGVPSERNPYSASVFSAEGYFVLMPDIVYRPQNPGLSAVDCVVPAVQAVLAQGKVDADRVGLVGHSWGAYQTAFIVTQTDVFAAGIAGAPLTNMMSMSMSIYWNSGQTDAWIFHESQGRMDRPFWRDVETYARNSPIFNIDQLDTPLLIAFGDEDGAVDFNQGVEMYNAARLAGKPLVMLVYPGENHGLAREPNQVDYHYRILEWFGHYLQGAEPQEWITEGKRHLDRQREIEKSKPTRGTPGAQPRRRGRR